MEVGEHLVFPLPSYAGSGNSWSAVCLGGHAVATVSVELDDVPQFQAISGDGATEPPSLMLVTERVVVCGLASGEAIWQLVLARSFDLSKPTATHILRVIVKSTSHS
jgi:hypothetical protein